MRKLFRHVARTSAADAEEGAARIWRVIVAQMVSGAPCGRST
jgi:hypothetical protein